ncbi:DUF255 domain-containing protein [Pedobacter sp. KR3-3]|uniref:DUF255 domain-containing protein n=1 Tax=Pedobacter albus TaxID=3113905 RepID=A0ABU7IAI5_9SPHI|nr:DUF255 domain-containing protein [Pedobacter sp. KR3-3]MEE1946369.1 DUF255 domain-containing protein [Pedobacter sp. KR3-3]
MKKLVWALSLLLMTAFANAAEINFMDNPAWSTVLEKAKKENKLIFLDGYATWCGPCKTMDAETYKNQAVADYFNANFVNVKYDMEKGEGPKLAEQYQVTAYPSLLFINANGNILHKGVGFHEAADFVTLGQTAKNPETQFFTLKSKAMELSNAQFVKFAAMATQFEDEDFTQISNDYLAKQADIVGNADLIDLVMNHIETLPDEKSLAYIIANKDKIVKGGKYTAQDVEERIIGLTLGYAVSGAIQGDSEEPDFAAVKTILDKYIPEKSFFIYHFFQTQYFLNSKKTDEAIKEFNILLDNTPAKVDFEHLCNAMMTFGPVLAEEGKLAPLLTKFESIALPAKDAKKAYLKDYVKAILFIKAKDFEKFKTIANRMIANPDTPDAIKEDLKSALDQIGKM